MRNNIIYIILLSVVIACSSDADESVDETLANASLLLSDFIENEDIQIDNVIACASGSLNPNEIVAYVYPRPGTTDIRYFETETANVPNNDYTLYTQINLPELGLFNGFLRRFVRQTDEEKWVIITFREGGEIHLSNPIRLRHLTRNTIFSQEVGIDQETSTMPRFNWPNLVQQEDAIYFQAITDASDEFLSGTYTFDPTWQYYNLDNVVLNITEETPPDLIVGDGYSITLMGVSEDNWVNFFEQSSFITQ